VPLIIRLAALFYLCVSFELQAGVFKWVDEQGRTHFGDRPPVGQPNQKIDAIKARKTPEPVATAQSEYRPPAASQTLRIRKLLETERFEELNRILADSSRAVRKNIANEAGLRDIYLSFQKDDPAWESLFERWISQFPNEHQGYLARATYLVHRGWQARGGAYADKTSQENLDQMVFFMDRAQDDLRQAMSLKSGELWAYCLRINIAKSGGRYPDALGTLEQATKRYPATYLARKYYIETLDPKWGGSPMAMMSFADSAQHYVGANPELRQLVSFAYYEAGRMAYINKEYRDAIGFLSIAIEKSGRPRSHFMRGKSYARQGDHEKALSDFNAAIDQDEENGDFYFWRAKSFAALKHYDESLMDIQRAHALKPADKWIDEFRRKLVVHARAPDIPTRDVSGAGSEAAEQLFRQAKKMIKNKQPEQAKVALDRAITMSPTEFRYYQLMDHALFMQGKTREILDYWAAYLSKKPNDHRAYLERSGTYYHLQDFDAAAVDARKAMDLGNTEAKRFYHELKQLTES